MYIPRNDIRFVCSKLGRVLTILVPTDSSLLEYRTKANQRLAGGTCNTITSIRRHSSGRANNCQELAAFCTPKNLPYHIIVSIQRLHIRPTRTTPSIIPSPSPHPPFPSPPLTHSPLTPHSPTSHPSTFHYFSRERIPPSHQDCTSQTARPCLRLLRFSLLLWRLLSEVLIVLVVWVGLIAFVLRLSRRRESRERWLSRGGRSWWVGWRWVV